MSYYDYPPPPPPPWQPGPPAPVTSPTWPAWSAAIGAVLVFVGSFLPWVEVTAPFIGSIDFAGTDGDGKITLALAGVMLLGVLQSGWRIVGMVAAISSLAVAAYDISNVSDAIHEAERVADGMVTANVGVGLWVCLAGAVVGLAGCIANKGPDR